MSFHNAEIGPSIHVIHNFTYADAPSRAAAVGLLSTDIGKVALQSNNNSYWILQNNSPVTWAQITGSGSESSGINYILNPDAEADTSGWATYKNTAGASPVNGTGGSPTHITFTRTTSSPLRGLASFLMTNAGVSSAQGEGVSYNFTIDPADLANVLSVSFDYTIASGTFTAGSQGPGITPSDVTIWLYDVTNAQVIQPAPYIITGNGSNKFHFKSVFQTNSNSTSYRLIFHVGTTNTNAWALEFDNVAVGPQQQLLGAAITDWNQFTMSIGGSVSNPTKGTTTLDQAVWRRVGDSMEIHYDYHQTAAGTNGSGTYTFALPPGYSIDASKMFNTSVNGNGVCGYAEIGTTGAFFQGQVMTFDSQHVSIKFIDTSNASGVTNDYSSAAGPSLGDTVVLITFTLLVPILGWSSTVEMSSDTSTRVVAARAFSATNSIPNNVQSTVINSSVTYDTHSEYNSSTGIYTVPVAGKYQVAAALRFVSTAWVAGQFAELYIVHNGVTHSIIDRHTFEASNTSILLVAGSDAVNCNVGDTLNIAVIQNNGVSVNLDGSSFADFERISGPSVIAATELVTARYAQSSMQSITSSYTQVNFADKSFDSHGAVTTGASWAFTAPISGIYRISARITSNNLAYVSGDNFFLALFKNGAEQSELGSQTFQASITSNASAGGTDLVQLNAGDIVDCRAFANRAGGAVTLIGQDSSNYITIEKLD